MQALETSPVILKANIGFFSIASNCNEGREPEMPNKRLRQTYRAKGDSHLDRRGRKY